ncbi:hypothetical protein BHE74_00041338 [Ensete ventricosum]|nr:hypothetical protein BHE74_00041338 [Ensete ventricosum]
MALSLLPPQREGRAHVRGAWLRSTGRPRCTARGPPSSANMIRDILVDRTLVRPVGARGIVRFGRTRTMALSLLPPQREGRAHVRGAWLESTGRPRCTARGPPSNAKNVRAFIVSNEVSIPESRIFFIAYHTAAPHHAVRGPCGEARACR